MIKLLVGDALEQLRTLPDETVHCCVTSPPYWGLRTYSICPCTPYEEYHPDDCEVCGGSGIIEDEYFGIFDCSERKIKKGVPDFNCPICRGTGEMPEVKKYQLGLEKTPEEYIQKLVEIFREVKRVLRKDGTCWVNMGDCYAHSGPCGGESPDGPRRPRELDRLAQEKMDYHIPRGLKPKDLVGMSWRLALALQADGWWLRSDIIWSKPNPMPESVTDRPTKAHEYIFLLTKNSKYFYDQEAVRETYSPSSIERQNYLVNSMGGPHGEFGAKLSQGGKHNPKRLEPNPSGRNTRTVWEIATQPYAEAHFATFPEELPRRCIKAGTSEKGCCPKCGSPWERIIEKEYLNPVKRKQESQGDWTGTSKSKKPGNLNSGDYPTGLVPKTIGWQPTCSCSISEVVPCIVLDPFAGSGTTGQVARSLGRKSILIELNPEYAKLIENRALSNVPDICEMTT